MERATRFYEETLGLARKPTPPGVSFFEMGKTWLALFPRDDLAEDAGVELETGPGHPRFSLAHNVRSPEEVDALLIQAVEGGGTLVSEGSETTWGGYTGYFADTEGFLWEVAWNPHFPHV